MRQLDTRSITDPYDVLGVRRVIHAGGVTTDYGGSRAPQPVWDSMAIASRSFVEVTELNEAVGAYIAEVTGAEAGLVTAGSASGLVLSAAACMTGTDVTRVRQLPRTEGLKNEIVIQRVHFGQFMRMYQLTGASFVDVGDMNRTLPDELDAAITARTAAVAYLCAPGIPWTGLTLPEVVAVAHTREVPVIVDAAAMLPPKDNLRRFIREGADLVVIAGGKYMAGPQDTALLFGRADLVSAAAANQSPNLGVGRPQKVPREDMIGLYTALRAYVESDEAESFRQLRVRLEPVLEAVSECSGVAVSVCHDDYEHYVPTAVLSFDGEWRGPTVAELAARLLAGDPRIYVKHDAHRRQLWINPTSLNEAEAELVAAELSALLSLADPARHPGAR